MKRKTGHGKSVSLFLFTSLSRWCERPDDSSTFTFSFSLPQAVQKAEEKKETAESGRGEGRLLSLSEAL